jgi:hypothetical protein
VIKEHFGLEVNKITIFLAEKFKENLFLSEFANKNSE